MSKRSSTSGNSPTPKTQRPSTSSQKSGSSQPFEEYLENSFSFLDDNSESLHDPPDTECDLPDTDPPDTESNPLTPAPTNPSSQESQQSFSFLDSQRGPEHLLLDDHGGAPCDGDEALSIACNMWSPLNDTNNTDQSASQPDAFTFDHQKTEATLEDILEEHIAKGESSSKNLIAVSSCHSRNPNFALIKRIVTSCFLFLPDLCVKNSS